MKYSYLEYIGVIEDFKFIDDGSIIVTSNGRTCKVTNGRFNGVAIGDTLVIVRYSGNFFQKFLSEFSYPYPTYPYLTYKIKY